MMKNSRTWNRAGLAGDVNAGVPGAGPSPATVKLRAADQGESRAKTAPPTIAVALTRRKYVPLGKPLTLSCVRVGIAGSPEAFVNPEAMMKLKAGLFEICQV